MGPRQNHEQFDVSLGCKARSGYSVSRYFKIRTILDLQVDCEEFPCILIQLVCLGVSTREDYLDMSSSQWKVFISWLETMLGVWDLSEIVLSHFSG